MVGAALIHGREAARRKLFTDACVIRRPSGDSVVDLRTATTYTAIHNGPCRLRTFRPNEVVVGQQSGATHSVARTEVQLPIGTPVLRVGDVVTITASRWDQSLVGLHYRVVDDDLNSSHATAYHVPVTRDTQAVMPPI